MRIPTLYQPVILNDHIRHKSGRSKTVCVTACLTALGVNIDSFHYTGTLNKPNFLPILGKQGLSCRSRKSAMGKANTIGACRKSIVKLNESAVYFVTVNGSGYCHMMLLNNNGETIVDTDPRVNDRRKVHSIHAVFRDY